MFSKKDTLQKINQQSSIPAPIAPFLIRAYIVHSQLPFTIPYTLKMSNQSILLPCSNLRLLLLFSKRVPVHRRNLAFWTHDHSITNIPVTLRNTKENAVNNMNIVEIRGPVAYGEWGSPIRRGPKQGSRCPCVRSLRRPPSALGS